MFVTEETWEKKAFVIELVNTGRKNEHVYMHYKPRDLKQLLNIYY